MEGRERRTKKVNAVSIDLLKNRDSEHFYNLFPVANR